MHDELTPQHAPASPGAASPRRRAATPSSSRMFASYLTDVERLLENHRPEAALREACDLPRLAVALADSRLCCLSGQTLIWCEEWVRPSGADGDAQGLDCERLLRTLSERLAHHGADGVPMRALRRLQLHRHLRTAPRGFITRLAAELSPKETEAREICQALIEAARRWYACQACHDTTVQANLARLAVLR
jgi:hypothetical protein